MRRLVVGCCGLCLALGASAHAGEFWTRVADVGNVTLRVQWVSVAALTAAAKKVGKIASTEPMGFAVLHKNTETGAFTCDVYIAADPARIDRLTSLLGHELSHCLGFSHDPRARRTGGLERAESPPATSASVRNAGEAGGEPSRRSSSLASAE